MSTCWWHSRLPAAQQLHFLSLPSDCTELIVYIELVNAAQAITYVRMLCYCNRWFWVFCPQTSLSVLYLLKTLVIKMSPFQLVLLHIYVISCEVRTYPVLSCAVATISTMLILSSLFPLSFLSFPLQSSPCPSLCPSPQCELNPRIPYTQFSTIIKKQKEVHSDVMICVYAVSATTALCNGLSYAFRVDRGRHGVYC